MSNVINVNFTGPNRGKTSKSKFPNIKYGVLPVRKVDRTIVLGTVITDINIEVWSKENGYEIVKWFKFNKVPSSKETTRLGFSNLWGN